MKKVKWQGGSGKEESSDDEGMSEAGADALEEFLEDLSARLDAIQKSLDLVLSNFPLITPSLKSSSQKT